MLTDLEIPHNTLSEIKLPMNPPPLVKDPHALNILLVEDMQSDMLLTRFALNASHIPYNLRTIQKGNEVLPSLLQDRKRGLSALPDVIILDMGLPCLDGFEVLETLATTASAIRAIPIIILTGYQHFEYVQKHYNLWIPAYIKKPCNPEEMRKVLNGIRFKSKGVCH